MKMKDYYLQTNRYLAAMSTNKRPSQSRFITRLIVNGNLRTVVGNQRSLPFVCFLK
jgi:hypothetical protein